MVSQTGVLPGVHLLRTESVSYGWLPVGFPWTLEIEAREVQTHQFWTNTWCEPTKTASTGVEQKEPFPKRGAKLTSEHLLLAEVRCVNLCAFFVKTQR